MPINSAAPQVAQVTMKAVVAVIRRGNEVWLTQGEDGAWSLPSALMCSGETVQMRALHVLKGLEVEVIHMDDLVMTDIYTDPDMVGSETVAVFAAVVPPNLITAPGCWYPISMLPDSTTHYHALFAEEAFRAICHHKYRECPCGNWYPYELQQQERYHCRHCE